MAASLSFNDFSEEIMFKCFQNLHGGQEALISTVVCKAWCEVLEACNDTMWKTYGAQEFGNTNLQAPPAPKNVTATLKGSTGVDRYASLARAASLKRALWGRVGTSGFGAREGTPWFMLGRTGEDIFAYGGYGPMGPANDLMVAPLSALKGLLSHTSAGINAAPDAANPSSTSSSENVSSSTPAPASDESQGESQAAAPRLDFARVQPKGSPPARSYGATMTPLVDDELPGCQWFDLDAVKSNIQDTSMLCQMPTGESAAKTTVFLVTGGYMQGGYRVESEDWCIGIVPPSQEALDRSSRGDEDAAGQSFQPPNRRDGSARQPREVIWVRPGPSFVDAEGKERNGPTARSNATAVYVPARFADSGRYPKGYVMLFGGNVDRRASNSVDLLDLSSFVWSKIGVLPNAPVPRNSHSGILMPDSEEPILKAKVLIFGGANGGDIPRAGEDFNDYVMFDPRQVEWVSRAARSPSVPGRAHVAVKIGRSVLFFGGGRFPNSRLSAVDCQSLSEHNAKRRRLSSGADSESEATPQPCLTETPDMSDLLQSLRWSNLVACNEGNAHPQPRSFHAAISLAPAGVPVLLIYGGWHPHYGNYGDIWAAKLDAWDTSDSSGSGVGERAREADRRFSQILSSPMAAANGDEDDDDGLEDIFGNDGAPMGPLVQVGGRYMPLQMFALLMRRELGEDATREWLAGMQERHERDNDDLDNDSDEDEEEDEPSSE